MLTTYCELTQQDGQCTIETGILGCDGVRRGAIADVDLFAAFSVHDLWEVFYINSDVDRQAPERARELSKYNKNTNVFKGYTYNPNEHVRKLAEFYEKNAHLEISPFPINND